MPTTPEKIKLVISLLAVFLIPGWTFILITGLWRLWRPLQRWIVAIAASLTFYPVLYYLVRFIVPGFRIGVNKNLALLLVGLLVIIFVLRRNWREQLSFDRWEIYALVIIGVTIFTRFWIIRDLPYPAWSDSLHHTLLTQLTAVSGRLPFNLEPYSPATLDMYHLGLYAITGVVQQLSGAAAYTALLWTAQLLNGLCAIGIYFVLDRFVGRRAAFAGIVVAGLLSFQPAWYVNWGRFTQLASQAVMLVALGVTWQLLEHIHQEEVHLSKCQVVGLVLLAAGLNAVVFLLHFRVAIYYFPLLIAVVTYELVTAAKKKRLKFSIAATSLTGAASLVVILPALVPAINAYLRSASQTGLLKEAETYFTYSSQTIFTLGLHPWLLGVTVVAGIFALLSRHRLLAILTWVWIAALFLEGNLYLLGIPGLKFTNFSGIMIAFYLPAAILVGLGIEALVDRIPQGWQERFSRIFIYAIFLTSFIASFYRSTGTESWRYFMTENDRLAMDWIKSNTPSNAIFAINTYMWMGGYPHGIDGGYWIPYFTGRQTNAETMMLPTNQVEHMKLIQARSQAIIDYISGTGSLHSLCGFDLNYIYAGSGNILAKPFDTDLLQNDPAAKLVYKNSGVMIFQICTDLAAR